MRTSELAAAYARTLYDVASLAESVDGTGESLEHAVSAVRGSVDLREALTDTSVPADAKRAVLRDIFGASMTPEALAVVTLLVDRGHAELLPELARAFSRIAEAERGVIVASVTTAVPLDDGRRAALEAKLSAAFGRPVSLRETVDAAILGGMVVKVAGRVIDGSVASQLDSVRRVLATPSGGEG